MPLHAIPFPEKLREVVRLIRLDKPYGTLLVMFPALWSLFIASNGRPTARHLLIFILGAFFMRSAGCVANDMADRKLDAKVGRTCGRPLAAQTLTLRDAAIVLALLLLASFGLVWMLNRLTILLSFGVLFVAMFYPFAKRFTSFAQGVLGLAFGSGSLLAWTAVNGGLEWTPWLILVANFFWAIGYDTVYAMMDYEEDIQFGVKSTAIFFGDNSGWAIGTSYAMAVLCLFFVGNQSQLGGIYYLSIGIASILFFRQTAQLQRPCERSVLFSLFKFHVVIGWIVLGGIALDYWVRLN